MLIDEPRLQEDNGKIFTFDGEDHKLPDTLRLRQGAYLDGLNNGMRRWGYEEYPLLGEVAVYSFGSVGSFQAYGVCDGLDNLFAACPELEASDRQFVVTLCEIRKDEEDEGGWRWHKWGPYIGAQTPTTEYLFDEPLIESVYCYHIYEKQLPPFSEQTAFTDGACPPKIICLEK